MQALSGAGVMAMPTEERPLTRAERRAQGAEGHLWPVVLALVLSAVVGSVGGWILLASESPSKRSGVGQRDQRVPEPKPVLQVPDERQQLLSRLKALQVDRPWFLRLVDSSLNRRFPDRDGRLPSDAPQDRALQQVWIELAEDWLARIERLPPTLRSQLGTLTDQDWRQGSLTAKAQAIPPRVVEHLISAAARDLLPGEPKGEQPTEPFRQLWIAAAMQTLADLRVESMTARSTETLNRSLRIKAKGVQLVTLKAPPNHSLQLGINGTPLMQMAVFAADGTLLEERGPLRVVSLDSTEATPVQLLVINNGVASGLITLTCRADPQQLPTAAGTTPPVAPPSGDDLDFDPMD